MIACGPDDRPEIPGLRWLAPPLALLLLLAGVGLMVGLWLPGRLAPSFDLGERVRHSALLRYGRLRAYIATGTLAGKVRCLLVGHTFRSSPRLAALIYHHFWAGLLLLGGLLLAAAVIVVV